MMFPGTRSEWFDGYPRFDYETGGRSVTVIAPSNPLPGRFWAWKGEFLNAFPGTELELLRRGVYIAYLSYPDQFGSPAAMSAWDAFYGELTGTYRFARKPALIGLSRGGLYCYAWAVMHPEKAACIFGDAPVCDVRSWPGGKGAGTGSPDEWRRFLEVFGYASEEEAVAFTGNPIDNLAPLARARVPILHVYGDADDAVPWDENTGVLSERYRALGGEIELIGKPGCGHHPHGLEDPKPIADFIIRHTV